MTGPASQGRPTTVAVVLGLAVTLIVAIVLGIGVGTRALTPYEVVDALRGHGDPSAVVLVREVRIPRTIIAMAVGVCLGVSGAVIQAVTRNPLADPGILGVNAGAGLAATLTVALSGQVAMIALAFPAMVGALAATIAVLVLGSVGAGPATPVRMTLSGVALAAVLGAITTTLRLVDPTTFEQMRAWSTGSVAGRSLDDLAWVAAPMIVGLVLALGVSAPLNTLALGQDTARSLGVNVTLVRIVSVVAIALLCGAATAIAGPIGFVGLMVPHAVRLLVGPNHRRVIAVSLLASPVLLLGSDVAARVLLPSRELPVGLVTAFLGAPVLIMVVWRRRPAQP